MRREYTKALSLLMIIFFLPNALLSQTAADIDSLKLELIKSKNDTSTMHLYNAIAQAYRNYQSDSTLFFGEKLMEIAERLNDKERQVRASLFIGEAYYRLGDYESAEIQFKKNLEPSSQLKNPSSSVQYLQCQNLVGLAIVSRRQNKNDEALRYLYQCVDVAKKKKIPNFEAVAYQNIFNNLFSSNSELALSYLQKAIDIFIEINDKRALSRAYVTLGAAYSRLDQHQKVIDQYVPIIDFFKEEKDYRNLDHIYSRLGFAHMQLGNIKKAEQYFQEMVEVSKQLNEKLGMVASSVRLAEFYHQTRQFEKVFPVANKAYKTANIEKWRIEESNALRIIAMTNVELQNFDTAFVLYDRLLELKDTMVMESFDQKLEALEVQFQTKEKQAQIETQMAQLAQQKNINIAFGTIALLLLALTLLAWRNIQQRKRTNEQLKTLDKSKSRFFANISHELRTPLTLISTPLEHVIENLGEKKLKGDIQLAYSNSQKMLALVDEIMDLSKLESGKLKLEERPINLFELTKRIFFSYESLAKLHQIKLSYDYQLDKDLLVKLDVNKFEKILNNLLSNALKFSTENDSVSLTIKESRKFINFEIKDTGKGIHSDDLPNIFDRFYQSNSDQLIGGTGIGLALSKELALLFGGELTAESKSGQGSIFSLRLPLKEGEKQEMSSKNRETPETSPSFYHSASSPDKEPKFVPNFIDSEKPKLLIVEDNPEMSNFLKKSLEMDYQCLIAKEGMEALSILEKEPVDLITSDVMMPKMDGFEFRQKLIEQNKHKRIPFIMLTARALEEDKLKGFQLGVDDYVSKPFSIRELKARIQNLLLNKFEREQFLNEQSKETEENLSQEEKLLIEAERIVVENLANPKFKVGDLAFQMNYSERQLIRIIKKLTGLTSVKFINEIRLQKAKRLLETRQFATISEVCYEVGYDQLSYFGLKFQERFGKKPSEI